MRRRSAEIAAAIGLIVLAILFYQFYLQNIVILYVGNKNYSELLQKRNVKVQGNTYLIPNTAKDNKPQVIGASPVKQQTDAQPPKPVEKVPLELPSKQDIEKLNAKEASELYEKYVITKQTSCKIIRLGNVQDGGWDICSDSGYEPRPNGSCLVYSVGINNDFSFDDAIAKKYGCTVHCYDPTMKKQDFKRSEKVFFHNTGLSNKNSTKGMKMLTLMSMRRELGHTTSPIDVLKIDIESWEHATVPEMVSSGGMKGIRQFAIEIHVDLGHIPKRDPRLEKYITVLKFLKDLYDAGFRIVHFHCNPTCVFKFKGTDVKGCSCHEVSFVNINSKS